MKTFKFSLDKVLSYKIHALEVEKAALKRLLNRREDLERAKRSLEFKERFHISDFEKRCRQGIPAGQMELIRAGISALRLQIESQQRIIKALEEEIDRQREKSIRLSGEKITLEKLREKQFERYKYFESKENEKFIDDFVQNKRFAEKAG